MIGKISAAALAVMCCAIAALGQGAIYVPSRPADLGLTGTYSARTYGAKFQTIWTGNLPILIDGAMTNGSAVLTCATSRPFTSAMVGWLVQVPGAGAAGAMYSGTIAAYTDSGHVTLAATAQTTVVGVSPAFGPDDTTPIQLAINAANAAGGGSVYLPAGTAFTGRLTLYANVKMYGCGMGATTLMLKPFANSAVIQTSGFATLTGTGSTGGISGFALSAFGVNANSAAQTGTSPAIQIFGYFGTLRDLYVTGAAGDGIYSEWGSGGPQPAEDLIENCRVDYSGAVGIHWRGPHDSRFSNCIISRSSSSSTNTYSGFLDENSSGVYAGGGAILTACHSWGSTQKWAFELRTQTFCSNCNADNCATGGVLFSNSNSGAWVGGWMTNQGGQAAWIALQIGDSTTSQSMSNLYVSSRCDLYSGSGTPTGAMAVNVSDTAGNNDVTMLDNANNAVCATVQVQGTPQSTDAFYVHVAGLGSTAANLAASLYSNPFFASANSAVPQTDTPAAHAWSEWSDPIGWTGSGASFVAGSVYLARIVATKTETIGHVLIGISTSGGTDTALGSYAGLYTVSGTTATLAGYTADQSTAWQASGIISMALNTGVSVTAGQVIVVAAYCAGAVTLPQFTRLSASTFLVNAGLAQHHYANNTSAGMSAIATGAMNLPASYSISNDTNSPQPMWAAVAP